MKKQHRIQFVADDVLPPGRDWMLCRHDGVTFLALRESARTLPAEEAAAVLEAAWAGYRAMTERGDVPACD